MVTLLPMTKGPETYHVVTLLPMTKTSLCIHLPAKHGISWFSLVAVTHFANEAHSLLFDAMVEQGWTCCFSYSQNAWKGVILPEQNLPPTTKTYVFNMAFHRSPFLHYTLISFQ